MLFREAVSAEIAKVAEGRVNYYWELYDDNTPSYPVFEVFVKGPENIAHDLKDIVRNRLENEEGIPFKKAEVDAEEIGDNYNRVFITFDPTLITEVELGVMIEILSLYGEANYDY